METTQEQIAWVEEVGKSKKTDLHALPTFHQLMDEK
jgi:hypothetical protein